MSTAALSVLGTSKYRRRTWSIIAALIVLGGLVLFPLAGEIAVIRMTDILIFALLALSLNLLVGCAGMISLGHAAFYALGGYAAGIIVKRLGGPPELAFLVAPCLGGLGALVVGLLSVQLTHAYFIMLTLAFGQLIYTVIWKWQRLTGGDDGLTGIFPPRYLLGPDSYYYFVMLVVLISGWLLYLIDRSPFGLALRAIRDNPVRAAAVGINVKAYQVAAFTVAGMAAGVAGGLQAFFGRGMFTSSAHWLMSADVLVVVVLGGPGYFLGPIVGALIFKVLSFSVPEITDYWPLILGIILLGIWARLPGGILSMQKRTR